MAETRCGFNDVREGASGADLLVSLGPTLFVNVGFDPDYDAAAPSRPNVDVKPIEALVDTGASESCIDNLLATGLGLPVIDRRQISGVGGKQIVNMYLAQIHVPNLGRTITGAFAGVDLRAGGQIHSVLIGRTFLRHYRMTYDGLSGTVIISDEPSTQPDESGSV